jgi:hypothetical protein
MLLELEISTEELTLTFDVSYEIHDEGIGPYEYWGATGNHTHFVPYITNVEVIDATCHTIEGDTIPLPPDSIDPAAYLDQIEAKLDAIDFAHHA